MWGQWLAVCFLKGFLVAWQGNIQWKVDSNPGVISFATMHSLKNSCDSLDQSDAKSQQIAYATRRRFPACQAV